MKKLLFTLPVLFFTLVINAQQTEDEVHIGGYPKGKVFGNYKRADTRPVNGKLTITGTVISFGDRDGGQDTLKGRGGYSSIVIKKDDGSIITVGTKDNGFTVPKEITGRNISIEGTEISAGRKRKPVRKDQQENIQFAATGIKVLD
jgi:hypothetical protein